MLGIVTGILGIAGSIVASLTSFGLAIQGLKTIGQMLVGVLKGLGIIKTEHRVNDLGDKSIQAELDGITPENYDNYDDYFKFIEEFELDPEKSMEISEDEKIQRGLELVTAAIVQAFPNLDVEGLLKCLWENQDYFSENKMFEIGKYVEAEKYDLNNIVDYMNGSEKNPENIEATMKTLMEIEKNINPNADEIEIIDKISNIRK